MEELYLHYLWRLKKVDVTSLLSVNGETVNIIRWGDYNTDAGPDFLNGIVQIGDKKWYGHIEIHLNSSHWYLHEHQNDPAYENVILHVVMENDRQVLINNTPVPTVEIRDRLPEYNYPLYEYLATESAAIPCRIFLKNLKDLFKKSWLDRLYLERLEEKKNRILEVFFTCNKDLEKTILALLARYLGGPVNGHLFERIITDADLSFIRRKGLVEAYVLGAAGMLGIKYPVPYEAKLIRDFEYLRNVRDISFVSPGQWKYARMYPVSFPSIRLVQLAALIDKYQSWYQVISQFDLSQTSQIFSVELHPYWKDHYIPGKPATSVKKKIGKELQKNIVINMISPLIYSLTDLAGEKDRRWKVVEMISELSPEKNKYMKLWKEAGLTPDNALESQALLHLYKNYCKKRHCLSCQWGHKVLSTKTEDIPNTIREILIKYHEVV